MMLVLCMRQSADTQAALRMSALRPYSLGHHCRGAGGRGEATVMPYKLGYFWLPVWPPIQLKSRTEAASQAHGRRRWETVAHRQI
jgi:hypothetical protein